VVQSRYSSPTLPPLLRPLHHSSTLFPPSSISRFPWETLPGCSSASPPTKHSSRPPKTFTSSPPGTSTPTHGPGRVRLPPQSSSPSIPETFPQWAPQFDSSPDRARLSAPTPPIGTPSARTAGTSAMSPPGAPQPTPFAPSAPSTIPAPCIDVPTPPALEAATLRLFLAVALPRPPAVSTVGRTILPPIGIAKAARRRPLSGVQPLPRRSFPRRRPATKWTQKLMTESSRPPPSPTRSLQSAFEMATPRARSTTILPAPLGPNQGNRSLPPAAPVSPSPMSRNPSGLAR